MKPRRRSQSAARITRSDDLEARPDPHQGGPHEHLDVERASASPNLPIARAAAVRRTQSQTSGRLPAVPGPLRSLQAWFAEVIMHPRDVRSGLRSAADAIGVDRKTGFERIIVSSPAVSAEERMGIYHFAYQARLVDCLADDFPCVAYALGQRAFTRLAHEVITRFPSDHPNLNMYGRRLVEHCRDQATRVAHRAFIAELAELEWSMCEVLHAQGAATLSQAELTAIPLERWGNVRFSPSQTLRIHRTSYPVNRYLQSHRDDLAPAIPAPAPSATAVYRQGFTVWRMDLTMPMCGILDSLCAGQPLAQALATLESTTQVADQQRLASQVMAWFRDWVEGGFFASFSRIGDRTATKRTAKSDKTEKIGRRKPAMGGRVSRASRRQVKRTGR